MHRKRMTSELHDSYFRSTMIKPVNPKRAEVARFVGQLWKEIAWAKKRGVWWWYKVNDFELKVVKFRCLGELVPSLPRVRFLGHRLTYTEVSRPHRRTIRIPLLIAPTSHKRPSRKYIFLYILRVVCLARAKRNKYCSGEVFQVLW